MSTSPTVVHSPDMDELWLDVNDKILWATKDELAYHSSLDTMMEDCIFLADSCEYSLNMGEELWLTPTRWTTLINQYIDPRNLMLFLDAVKAMGRKGRGIAAMDMKGVKATVVDDNPRANRRKFGGCMRMLVYRNFPHPTISLYSRTSYLGYIGGLDMMVAHKIAEQIAIVKNIPLNEIRFRWHVEMAQFHGFKSMSFIFTSSEENVHALTCSDKAFVKEYGEPEEFPTWKLVRYWYKRIKKKDKAGESYDDMKYGAEIRIRRRMHAFLGVKGFGGVKNKEAEPLDVPIERLTLDKVMFDRMKDAEVEEEYDEEEDE
jgi:hypothetical protein